jgi:hypothetical protein
VSGAANCSPVRQAEFVDRLIGFAAKSATHIKNKASVCLCLYYVFKYVCMEVYMCTYVHTVCMHVLCMYVNIFVPQNSASLRMIKILGQNTHFPLLGVFAKSLATTKPHVCPSFLIQRLVSHWKDFHEIWHFCNLRKIF